MNYLENLFSLAGKTAVVIGGTGELCGHMAQGLAQAGAEVIACKGRDSQLPITAQRTKSDQHANAAVCNIAATARRLAAASPGAGG